MHPKFNYGRLWRLGAILIGAVLLFLAVSTLYSFADTLSRLDQIEAERDQWQKPVEILRALDLREGSKVADLGSGSGYFSLKLSNIVGKQGHVFAVDLRKLSLLFLWTRALLHGYGNLTIILGDDNDPHLPVDSLDGVLICNTYHEFRDPERILAETFRSLSSGGRIVVVDRIAHENRRDEHHGTELSLAETALGGAGFATIRAEPSFIDRPEDDTWWLLTARKP